MNDIDLRFILICLICVVFLIQNLNLNRRLHKLENFEEDKIKLNMINEVEKTSKR